MADDQLQLRMQRNEDYQETWQLTDGIPTDAYPLGTPVDLTGWTAKGAIASTAGTAALLPLPEKTNYAASGVKFETPRINGEFTPTIFHGELKTAVGATNNAQGIVNLAFDIVLRDPTGLQSAVIRGCLAYEPEVTQWA